MTRVLATEQKGPPQTPADDFGDKVRAHVQYRLTDGTLVPGVTTVLQVLNKPALIPWANRLGLQGIDTRKYVDEAASIGTLAHYLIQCRLSGEVPQLADFSASQIERAQRCLRSFDAWIKDHKLRPHYLEKPMVSEQFRYGGTIDYAGWCNGKRALIDFKTAKAIWPEHRIQVSAYRQLISEAGHELEEIWVLQIGRSDDEGFSAHRLSDEELDARWRIFHNCLEIYRTKKALKD